MSDFYEILGVQRNAGDNEIKTAYRSLVLKTHPDRNQGRDEEFKKVKLAYDTLIDGLKRREYDRSHPPANVSKAAQQKQAIKNARRPKFKNDEEKFEWIARNDPNMGRYENVSPSRYDIWGCPVRKGDFLDAFSKEYERNVKPIPPRRPYRHESAFIDP